MNDHIAVLSLGSNKTDGEQLIKFASSVLSTWFMSIDFSCILRNPAINMPSETPDYFNMLVLVRTKFNADEIKRLAKTLERMAGDTKELRRNGVVIMDIDIVEYDNSILKPNDTKRDYYRTLRKTFG